MKPVYRWSEKYQVWAIDLKKTKNPLDYPTFLGKVPDSIPMNSGLRVFAEYVPNRDFCQTKEGT